MNKLQARNKWKNPSPNLKVRPVLLLKEEIIKYRDWKWPKILNSYIDNNDSYHLKTPVVIWFKNITRKPLSFYDNAWKKSNAGLDVKLVKHLFRRRIHPLKLSSSEFKWNILFFICRLWNVLPNFMASILFYVITYCMLLHQMIVCWTIQYTDPVSRLWYKC